MTVERFQPRSPQDVVDLVNDQRLAWIVSNDDGVLSGSTLPILVHTDDGGNIVRIEGHFGRSSPQLPVLQRTGGALILVLGPNAYVSPSWLSNPDWAPTWNFAHVQFRVALDFFEAPDAVEAHLRRVVSVMEAGRPNAWTPDAMGARFARLAQSVVGFHGRVVTTQSRFKLGQDEHSTVFGQILDGLGPSGLSDLMKRAAVLPV